MATREKWAAQVERWGTSGLTAGEFARRAGISERSLRWWKWRLGSQPRSRRLAPTAAASVSPLTFVEMTGVVRGEPFEVVLPSGIRVRVPAEFDASALRRLVDALEPRR